jgi:hypothetical protein
MEGICILVGCWMIADAICFVHGYRSHFFKAKTVEELLVRNKFINR